MLVQTVKLGGSEGGWSAGGECPVSAVVSGGNFAQADVEGLLISFQDDGFSGGDEGFDFTLTDGATTLAL